MPKSSQDHAVRILLAVIATLLAVAAMKIARPIMIPFVVSLFLALVLAAPIGWLKVRRIPLLVTSVLSVAVVIGLILLIGELVRLSVVDLSKKLPGYEKNIVSLLDPLWKRLEQWGLGDQYIQSMKKDLNLGNLASFLGAGVVSFFGFLTNVVLIFFITLFLLMEAGFFKEKLIKAFGPKTSIPESLVEISRDIQRYVALKTVVSFLTGSLVFLFLSIIELDFPLVWGFLAFVLNFVPNIGSIIASIPPALLAVIQFADSPWVAGVVLGVLAIIQVVVGFFVDPRVMGRGLHISALVVFLSMVFFGWLWGVIGILLAVPLVVSLKVVMMHTKALVPFGILLEG